MTPNAADAAPTWQNLLSAEYGHPYMTEREGEQFAALVERIEANIRGAPLVGLIVERAACACGHPETLHSLATPRSCVNAGCACNSYHPTPSPE